jgi:hypothetical protein
MPPTGGSYRLRKPEGLNELLLLRQSKSQSKSDLTKLKTTPFWGGF